MNELQSEQKFLSIFENSLNAILLGRPDGSVLEANTAALKMFGYGLEELKKDGRSAIFDHANPDMVSALEKREKHGSASGVIIGIRKNGERFPCEFTSVIFESENGESRTSTVLNDITQRKKSEEEMALLMNNTEESFLLLDKDLHIVSFNRSYGERYKSLLNKEVTHGDDIFEYVQPERKASVRAIYERVLKGEVINDEIKWNTCDNEIFIFSNRYKPAINKEGEIVGAFLTIRDVTEKRKAQQLILSNEKRFRSIIEHTDDLILLTDYNGNIIYASPASENVLGITYKEMVNKPCEFIIHPDHLDEYQKVFKELLRRPGVPIPRTMKVLHKQGHYIWVEGIVKNLLDDENVKAIVSNFRDISEKMRDLELRENMISELSQNNNDLKQFSYVTSHNLRAPIANLLGLTSLLEQYNVPDKSLVQILEGVRQAALMFDDTVKDLTKVLIIKDQKNIAKEKIYFDDTVSRVMKQLNISSEDIDYSVNLDFRSSPHVLFTHSYLESILINLFTNAIKYKSASRKLRVNLVSHDTKNFVELRFSDNGIGIDTEMNKDKLFKLYQRFHNQSEGKGLGLYLVKSQVEAMGGTIDIESAVDKGTTFIVKFIK